VEKIYVGYIYCQWDRGHCRGDAMCSYSYSIGQNASIATLVANGDASDYYDGRDTTTVTH